jgi:acyl dehydratase
MWRNKISLGGNVESVRKTYANNALRPNELDQPVLDGSLSVALAVGLVVSQVTDVTLIVLGSSVGRALRVDWYTLAWRP